MKFFGGLRGKLLKYFLLIGLVPLILAVGAIYFYVQGVLLQTTKEDFHIKAAALSDTIDLFLSERYGDIQVVANLPALRSRTASAADKTADLKSVQKTYGDTYLAISFMNANGDRIADSVDRPTINRQGRDYFEEAMKGKVYYTDAAIGDDFNRPILRFSAPVRDLTDSGRIIGVVVAQLDMQMVWNIADSMERKNKEIGENGYAWIINKEGVIIAHPDKNKILKENVAEGASKELARIARELMSGKGAGGTYIHEGVSYEAGYAPLKGYGDFRGNGWGLIVAQPTAEVVGAISSLQHIAIVLSIIVTIAVFFVATFIARGIAGPIGQMTQVAAAAAEGDLTREVPPIKTGDEVETMTDAFRQMVAHLRKLIREVGDSARQVAATSQELSASSEEVAKATQQISQTIQQVAQGATQQTQSATSTAASAQQLGKAIEQIAKGAQEQAISANQTAASTAKMSATVQNATRASEELLATANETSEVAKQGGQVVRETLEGMKNIRQTSDTVAEKIKELSVHSGEIGSMVKAIDDIAGQTNLLALNAAIEAARAGEQGKGFAVVADEVRKLSEQSGEAAKQITNTILLIQRSMDSLVKAMEDGARQTEKGMQLTDSTSAAFSEILKEVEKTSQEIRKIFAAAKEMESQTAEVVKAIDNIASITEESSAATEEMAASTGQVTEATNAIASISQENAASAEEVAASTQEVNASVEEMAASAETLAQMAQNLQEMVSKFKI
ncbi:MAG: methyl-accepting chemotaxis protein [Firmicutes bacterium]|nr:methyl-accepting chemotaxis protein [Bacillota bacterium]